MSRSAECDDPNGPHSVDGFSQIKLTALLESWPAMLRTHRSFDGKDKAVSSRRGRCQHLPEDGRGRAWVLQRHPPGSLRQ